MSDTESTTTVRASPGTAVARAVPDASSMRNHVRPDSETRRYVHGD